MNTAASQSDIKAAKSIFWASLAVLFFVIGAMGTAFYPIVKEQMGWNAEIGFGGWTLFLPGIICLVIGNYMSWDVVIALMDRITPFFGGKNASASAPEETGTSFEHKPSLDDNYEEGSQ